MRFQVIACKSDQDIYISLYDLLSLSTAQLHQTCLSVQPKDVPDLLYSLRTTAKFLGFLEFLPYIGPPTTIMSVREMVIKLNFS